MSPRSKNNIGAVILAAGESSRFGRAKQLVEFHGQSLVRRIFDAAQQASCWPIVVVIGSNSEEVRNDLGSTNAVFVENNQWQRGIGTSIRAGIKRLTNQGNFPECPAAAEKPPLLDGIILLVCDQPFVNAGVIEKLIALRERTRKPIVASSYDHTLGVPALFDRCCFKELIALDDASGAKPVILLKPDSVAMFPFPDGSIDIDTVTDYEKLVQLTR